MKCAKIIASVTVLLLTACGHPPDRMAVPMGKIRVMVKQAVAVAVQAACTAPPLRPDLVHAAAVLLRRATAGPEMASIHRMMGQMQADSAVNTPATAPGKGLSPQQKMHLAIHAAGGDAFDLLDAMTQRPGVTCADVRPVSLAVAAALLRENHDRKADAAVQKLDREVADAASRLDGEVQGQLGPETPDAVRALALALQKI